MSHAPSLPVVTPLSSGTTSTSRHSPSASVSSAPLLSMHSSIVRHASQEGGHDTSSTPAQRILSSSSSSPSVFTCSSVPSSVEAAAAPHRDTHITGTTASDGRPGLRNACGVVAMPVAAPPLPHSDEDVEEVHSCVTLSSTRTSPTSSQPRQTTEPAPSAAHTRTDAGDGHVHADVVEDEDCHDAPPLLSSGHSSFSRPPTQQTPMPHVVGSSEASTARASPSPAPPHAAVTPSCRNAETHAGHPGGDGQPRRSYPLLDSESSGLASHAEAGLFTSPPPTQNTTTTTATTNADTTATSSTSPSPSSAEAAAGPGGATPSVTEAPPAATGEAALSDEQRSAYHLAVKERRSIFITGGAGTGKSHLLRTIIQRLPFSSTFVTATTGIAALNLNGTTLHSFVGCGVPDRHATKEKILHVVLSKMRCVRNWRLCRVLIIDEVSMLNAAFFELVDFIARQVRNRPDEPFGGIQLILSGDFLQLPPVMKDQRKNENPFCFECETWIAVNPKICHLSTPFRQRDLRFFSLLNEMRFGDLQADSIALLHSIDTTNRVHFVRRANEQKITVGLKRERSPDSCDAGAATSSIFFDPASRAGERQTQLELVDGLGNPVNAPFDGYTILRPTRAEVDAQNEKFFNQLDTEVYMYVGAHTGAGTFPENNLSSVVHLRKGCRVMVIKNFDVQSRLVNGSTGTVTGFVSFAQRYNFKTLNITHSDARDICVGRGRDVEKAHTMLPIVAFDSRNPPGQATVDEIVVEPQEWVEKEGSRTKSRSVQIPLVLAYAITIHKSQGMSLTQVDIDFNKVFEAGQSYVALSRCTDLKRVRLHGFNVHLVSANSKALAYYKALSLQQRRVEWQRVHTPHIVAAVEDAEARSCTPYGYVLPNDAEVMRRYGEEDSRRGPPVEETDVDGGVKSEDSNASGDSEASANQQQGGKVTSSQAAAKMRADMAAAVAVTETRRLDDLRRRITPYLYMSDLVKRLVLREMLPLPRVRNSRLVMDIDALFHLVTGPESAVAFDVLFGEQDNMMRVPLCVQQLIEEAAAYRSTSATPDPLPPTRRPHRTGADDGPPSPPSVSLPPGAAADVAARPDSAILEASDVAAEALAVMERAKQDFILDVQREEQRAALPEPRPEWMRFVDVLPLLRRPPAPETGDDAAPLSSQRSGLDDDAETTSEVNFLLNRDPRETVQHRAILEYALFLRDAYGDDVAVCTASILLAAYARAWGLRVVSVEYLF